MILDRLHGAQPPVLKLFTVLFGPRCLSPQDSVSKQASLQGVPSVSLLTRCSGDELPPAPGETLSLSSVVVHYTGSPEHTPRTKERPVSHCKIGRNRRELRKWVPHHTKHRSLAQNHCTVLCPDTVPGTWDMVTNRTGWARPS